MMESGNGRSDTGKRRGGRARVLVISSVEGHEKWGEEESLHDGQEAWWV